jgi:glutamate-1-semialdehyde 2,1-aminomutase
VEVVRLVNSGTEATMSAARLARAATDRSKVIKFRGGYHGHADIFLVEAGSGAATIGVPSSPGVPNSTAGDTLVAEYNDLPSVELLFDANRDAIACVIVEPVAGNMGCVPPAEGFLEGLRELCTRTGALLIFDEVMTGFRVAYGGAQARYDVLPDLTTLGKIVGGGLPVGAYGGRAEIMDHVLPAGKVFQAGTLSGNPLATAAGIATLMVLRNENPYDQLEQISVRLQQGLQAAAESAGVPHTCERVGSMMTLFFNPEPVHSWEVAQRCDTKAFARYFWGLMDRGVYMPCSQYEALFVSAAHKPEDIDATVSAAEEVFATL